MNWKWVVVLGALAFSLSGCGKGKARAQGGASSASAAASAQLSSALPTPAVCDDPDATTCYQRAKDLELGAGGQRIDFPGDHASSRILSDLRHDLLDDLLQADAAHIRLGPPDPRKGEEIIDQVAHSLGCLDDRLHVAHAFFIERGCGVPTNVPGTVRKGDPATAARLPLVGSTVKVELPSDRPIGAATAFEPIERIAMETKARCWTLSINVTIWLSDLILWSWPD